MNRRLARALRPTAMAIVAERKVFALYLRRLYAYGAASRSEPFLPPPTTPMRAMVRADASYNRRVVEPVRRANARAAAWRPWWLS